MRLLPRVSRYSERIGKCVNIGLGLVGWPNGVLLSSIDKSVSHTHRGLCSLPTKLDVGREGEGSWRYILARITAIEFYDYCHCFVAGDWILSLCSGQASIAQR